MCNVNLTLYESNFLEIPHFSPSQVTEIKNKIKIYDSEDEATVGKFIFLIYMK